MSQPVPVTIEHVKIGGVGQWNLSRGLQLLGIAYTEADARLWAASYELLGIVKTHAVVIDMHHDGCDDYVDQAIARAEGK